MDGVVVGAGVFVGGSVGVSVLVGGGEAVGVDEEAGDGDGDAVGAGDGVVRFDGVACSVKKGVKLTVPTLKSFLLSKIVWLIDAASAVPHQLLAMVTFFAPCSLKLYALLFWILLLMMVAEEVSPCIRMPTEF